MSIKGVDLFLRSAGILLVLTAAAKFISSFGTAGILGSEDPILKAPYHILFWAVGVLELMVGLVCFFGSRSSLQAGFVVWLATMFLVYRFGLLWIGYHRPCPCLGNLTDALHISPQVADTAMKIILAYLLIGGYGSLLWLWRQHRKMEGRMQNVEVKLELEAGS